MMNRIIKLFTGRFINVMSFEESVLRLMITLEVISMSVSLIFDILCKENIVEIVTLLVLLLTSPSISVLFIKYQKVKLGLSLQLCVMIFVVLPISFFFGGGPKGGGVFWIGFTYMFIGLAASGRVRSIFCLLNTLMALTEFGIWGLYGSHFYQHTDEMLVVDSLVSAVLTGLCVYAMVRVQKNLFKIENRRAQEETKRVEELNRSQNAFFSSMSHEIRTPINSILGLNELILRQDNITDEVRRDAGNIQGAGKMLLVLVNDILDLSKIRAGKMDIVPVNYDVGGLISEIVNMVWLRAEEKGLKLIVDIDPSLPKQLYGDEVRIKQVLINILNNAVKYTKDGSVSLHMECEERLEDKVHLGFSVSDTGMGIKQEAIPHLFDAFQRLDQEENRMIEGTGLGLSIVKQLVDLMDGSISVSSVYGEGSTFSVELWQNITEKEEIGDINISQYSKFSAKVHMCGFLAPDAKILIIDDNEMNLEVEEKLLADTNMTIHTALSGLEALKLTIENQYDVIFMDHLMPEMDGIHCFAEIRKQVGGLNNRTPIIVLTANAGSENKELYGRVGFDGYLVKPVSGWELEEALLKHLPENKITEISSEHASKQMNTAKGYAKKQPIQITTSSMCDLPPHILKELSVDIIPFTIHTNMGEFYDNEEMSSDELIQYMSSDEKRLDSEPPKVEEFEHFFAKEVKKAHHVIHIALTTGMSEEYHRAKEAAKTFDNVTVINAKNLSSSLGILVMIASRLVSQGMDVEAITEELNRVKERIHCSFIIANMDYLHRRNFISDGVYQMVKTLELRPALQIKDDKFGVGKLWRGSVKKCYGKYISFALPKMVRPDLDLLFITYADVAEEDLQWIKSEVEKRYDFKNIVFQKASAAISLNCGPGTFGLLYMEKGKEEYNLNALLKSINDSREYLVEKTVRKQTNQKWYETIEGIDGKVAIKSSGSEDALRSVLQIFYDSIKTKSRELEEYYEAKNWENYTIKVHALKSSARLVGAMELSDAALKLEEAGKNEDISFIEEHHEALMKRYGVYEEILAPLFGIHEEEESTEKTEADPALMESVYEGIREAAEEMELEQLESIFEELADYRIPKEEEALFLGLKEKFELFDYDGMIAALDEAGK
ncbi:MAG: DegV family EDD domain-containing protein [Lachnospiraceae bacterium]|nr:DegV family EDD domain-containing protein [Lachnospiraceae bacterium]